MSKIPPRTLNCATSSTIGTRSNPTASRCRRDLGAPESPARSSSLARCTAPGRRVRSRTARAVVRRIRTPPRATRSSVSTRSPATSACGSASPKPSRGGYSATVASAASDCRSASQRSASGTPCATTTRNRPGSRRESAATSTAADDPGSPATVRRSPGPGSVSRNSPKRGKAFDGVEQEWKRHVGRELQNHAARPPRAATHPAARPYHRTTGQQALGDQRREGDDAEKMG